MKRRSGKTTSKTNSKYTTNKKVAPEAAAKYNSEDATHEVIDGKYRGFRVIVLGKTSTTQAKIVLLVNARGKPYSERSPKLVDLKYLREDLIFYDALECPTEDGSDDGVGDVPLVDEDAKTTEEEYPMQSETKLFESGFLFNPIKRIVHCSRRLSGRCDPKDGLVEWKDIHFAAQVGGHQTSVLSLHFVAYSTSASNFIFPKLSCPPQKSTKTPSQFTFGTFTFS